MPSRTLRRFFDLTTGALAIGLAAAVTPLGGCSSGEDPSAYMGDPPGADQPFPGVECQDADGDGFGRGCAAGLDCDDEDPTSTDECYRCKTPAQGCPCSTEGQTVACGELASQSAGHLNCAVGSRVCTAGRWGGCEVTSMIAYPTQPPRRSGAAISGTASNCANNPCDPYCQDFGNDSPTLDGGTAVTGDGITLGAAPPADAGAGGACANVHAQSKQSPLGMMLEVDTSGSMTAVDPGSGGKTRWARLQKALNDFVKSPGANGMSAGLHFFPYYKTTVSYFLGIPIYNKEYKGVSIPSSGKSCSYLDGDAIPIGELPGAGAPTQQTKLVNAIAAIDNSALDGNTPMNVALNNALIRMTTWVKASAQRKGVVVLVTDGLPTFDCSNCDAAKKGKSKVEQAGCGVQEVANIAKTFYQANPPIETFVIGIDDGSSSQTSVTNLHVIARAGSGGKRDALIVSPTTTSDGIVGMLNSIRNEMLSCDYPIPTPPGNGLIDANSATVTLTYSTSAGATKTDGVAKVTSAAACGAGDGFYLDTLNNRLTLCPTTCGKATTDLTGKVDVTYSCQTGCSGGAAEAPPGALDMVMLVDRSGSMDETVVGGAAKKWMAVSGSIQVFVNDPSSEGIRFGMSFFPPSGSGDCTGCGSCKTQTCKTKVFGVCVLWGDPCLEVSPIVPYPACKDRLNATCSIGPQGQANGVYYSGYDGTCAANDFFDFNRTHGVKIGLLPGAGRAQAIAVESVLGTQMPNGNTPTASALQGAYNYAKANRQSGRKMVIVLATDGLPTKECDPSNSSDANVRVTNVANVAASAYADGIDVYVVGVYGDKDGAGALSNLDKIAKAGSGNKQAAFFMNSGNPGSFIDAMNKIRKIALPCEYDIPQPPSGKIDYGTGQVVVSAGKPPTATALAKVNGSAACGNQQAYYYDSSSPPKQLVLCPTACDAVKTGDGSRVDFIYQCANDYQDGTAVFEYDTTNVCPSGTAPTWADWSWTATTPGDSKIDFQLQTGSRSGGVITNLSAAKNLWFTRAGLDEAAFPPNGKQVCASAANVCTTVDTQKGGPLNGRPGDAIVDASLRLDGLPRSANYLRITAGLHTSTDKQKAPTLSQWDLRVSCQPAE